MSQRFRRVGAQVRAAAPGRAGTACSLQTPGRDALLRAPAVCAGTGRHSFATRGKEMLHQVTKHKASWKECVLELKIKISICMKGVGDKISHLE